MAIAVHFKPQGMTHDVYHSVFEKLAALGMDRSPERLTHACFEVDGRLEVLDVWTSPEAFQEFGKTLVPILSGLGVVLPPPTVTPAVHTMARGEHFWA